MKLSFREPVNELRDDDTPTPCEVYELKDGHKGEYLNTITDAKLLIYQEVK